MRVRHSVDVGTLGRDKGFRARCGRSRLVALSAFRTLCALGTEEASGKARGGRAAAGARGRDAREDGRHHTCRTRPRQRCPGAWRDAQAACVFFASRGNGMF